jgi:hypothetical protein
MRASTAYLRALPDVVQLSHIPRRTYILRLAKAAIVTPSIRTSDASKSSVFAKNGIRQRLRISHTFEQYVLAIRRRRELMLPGRICERQSAIGCNGADL